MANTPIRIKDLPLATDIPEGAYVAIDSALDSEDSNTETRKYPAEGIGKVTQTSNPSSSDANYRVLLGNSANNSEELGAVHKSELIYNPRLGSFAENITTAASGSSSHAEGYTTTAAGNFSHAEGMFSTATGSNSHAEGEHTIANHGSQHVFGEYNIADPSTALSHQRGNYVEIVGNGTADNSRSNARTLDWSGNEVLAGKLTVGANPTNNMDVATKEYVDNNTGTGNVADVYVNGVSVLDADTIAQIKSYKEVTQAEYDALPDTKLTDGVMYCIKDSEFSAEDVPYDNSDSQAQSTNVQDALDEAFERTVALANAFSDISDSYAQTYYILRGYSVGDYVLKDRTLYKCISPVASGGEAWNPDKWEEVKLADEIKEVKEDLAEEKETVEDNLYVKGKIENKSIATFTDGSDLPLASLKTTIVPIQSGSGDPSPTNIRPISGWSGANVSVCGKNFYNPSFTRESGYYDDNGVLQTSSTTGHTQLTPINSNTEYYFSIHARSNGGGKFAVYFWDANRNWISRVSKDYSSNFDDNNITFTTPNNCRFISFQVPIGTSVTSLEFDDSLTMICLNSLGTDFEAYNGTTYNIPFTDSQGNPIEVFGGECDVVNGGGSAYKEYDSYNGETLIGPWISDRDVYAPNTSPTIGAQVVDMGDTSTFYTQPTSPKSIVGVNNVWGDCGQIKDLKYVRNLNITINDLISRVEALEG